MVPVPQPRLPLEAGEHVLGSVAGTTAASTSYGRYCAVQVVYSVGAPAIVVGSPRFLTGFLLGSILRRATLRRRARRLAAPQWRPAPVLGLVVTTRRLWCQIAEANRPRWLHFNYDTITSLDLTGNTLTLTFQASEPLRLTGECVPWCAAVIAHHRYR